MSGSTTGAAAPLRARGALACLWGLAAVFVVLGHDGRRVAQLLILFLPLMAWLRHSAAGARALAWHSRLFARPELATMRVLQRGKGRP